MPAPAAGFNTYAGSAGRVKIYLVTPDLTVGPPVFPVNPVRTVVNGAKKWAINPKLDSAKIRHFESPGDSFGVIYPTKLQGGLGDWTVTIEGYYDADSAGSTDFKFHVGQFLVVDLIFSKASGYGRYECQTEVIDVAPSVEFSSEPSNFRALLDGFGVPPEPGFP